MFFKFRYIYIIYMTQLAMYSAGARPFFSFLFFPLSHWKKNINMYMSMPLSCCSWVCWLCLLIVFFRRIVMYMITHIHEWYSLFLLFLFNYDEKGSWCDFDRLVISVSLFIFHFHFRFHLMCMFYSLDAGCVGAAGATAASGSTTFGLRDAL